MYRILYTGKFLVPAKNQEYLLGFPSWYLTRPRILIASAALVVINQLREGLIPSAPLQT